MQVVSEGYVGFVTPLKNCVRMILLAFALVWLPMTADARDGGDMPERLRLGVIVAADEGARERVEPFRLALEEIADLPVDLFLLKTMGEAVEAIASGRIDYVRLSPSAYAAAHELCACVEPLVTAGPDDFPARFYAILVARRGPEKSSLADLAGTRLAVGARQAVTGYRVPLANLAADGINARTHFSTLVEVRDPLEGLRAVLDGRVQSSLAWSTLAGEAKTGYTAGTLNDYYVAGGPGFKDLEIVWRSPPIPYSAHSLRTDLPDALKRRVRAGLMDLRREAPDAYLAIEPDLPGGFEPVVHGDYRPVLRTYEDDFAALLDPSGG
ncbi:phosphate/phosphite/phosphonate ABC transporter substrate-binding protein [Roseibium marinum]|uniref:Phosphate/phosphite/phosphonate ABC transporter binding protein n=1 Tax=Roseibium marinum TaxID=281252 RepID=A0A2S3V3E2_9HYPH|nr:PhnD/SsuA/transferrin family substrate-binding protein [Roseibium marinum]POF34435.1 phosphate/phosphite/phosphonate ABC transporter binding protein [Roseibium marinum]